MFNIPRDERNKTNNSKTTITVIINTMSNVIENTTCPVTPTPKIFGSAGGTSELNNLYNDKFDTILDLPSCLRNFNRANKDTDKEISLEKLELSVRSISIPDISIPTDKIAYGVGSHSESRTKYDDFPDIDIQFKLDDNMSNYWAIYRWMQMLVDVEKGVVGGFEKNQYSTTYNVFLLGQYKKPIGLYTFHGVIPTKLGGFPLDNNTEGDVIYIDFAFSYDRMTFDLRTDIYN